MWYLHAVRGARPLLGPNVPIRIARNVAPRCGHGPIQHRLLSEQPPAGQITDLWPYAPAAPRRGMEGTACACRTRMGGSHEVLTSHRGQGTGARRSSRLALSPYLLEDVAITAAELQRVRAADTVVVGSRV